MENQYELQLRTLIDEYDLNYSESFDSVIIHNILMDLFKTQCEGKRVALWGAGRKNTENSHAAIILKKYTTYIQGMNCLIDSMPELWGDEFMGYPIIAPKDILKQEIDIVIIASKVQSDSIIQSLKEYAPSCGYIDIYKELELRGIKIYYKFYEESNIYTNLYQIRKIYENEQDQKVKEEALRNLIKGYLSIQDFHYAELYGELYISSEYKDYIRLKEFFDKLNLMIQEIQSINSKKRDDVVIFFVDSLRAMDVFQKKQKGEYEAQMLKAYLKDSVIFTNAKSTGVTTYESMISVIKKKYPYEQNVYENNIMANFDEFSLLPLAKEMGYQIHLYVSEGYQIIHNHPDVSFTKQVYLTSKLWKLTTDMACSQKKTFNFAYVPYELHFPLVCGYHEKEPQISGFVDVGVLDTKEYVPRQLEECKAYVDKQFAYYHNWFSKDILFSLFSDHSQVVYDEREQRPYFMYYNDQDRCVNVTFFIKGFGLKQKWLEDLVSLYDFCDIMESLMKTRELKIPHRSIAVYQYYKIHYKKLREHASNHGMYDYIDGMQCFTSKDYIYIITSTGVEEVYRIGEKINLINTQEGARFAEKVRKQHEILFPQFILAE